MKITNTSLQSKTKINMLETLNKHKWWLIITIGIAMILYVVLT